ncbi:adenylyltransferase and sulfurtransferase MOCS3 isoform X2 [Anopheles ziemanni]|uniref:adenylyltransferase and sulfurtransferase MOCS3 isoform X2 n=1 Tax=Anopheles coustani TaxID=139045 RepID=UPI002658F039|nr:adenylyltransferase and sulfurtransferase MOCS3 isoform X2 [Anopheles coustani]XP_058174224.1 adenylyltransferase and sulfurtransferase MOCS3 isoform X2 [Anopheles ziemanni]
MGESNGEMEIEVLENDIRTLRKLLREKVQQLKTLKKHFQKNCITKLNNDEIARYSRQIILSDIGVQGQLKLKKASVLVVGAGGLGCPSALYLAGAGIGRIGVLDYDEVELTNLHRQLLHTEATIGLTKVDSVQAQLEQLNSQIEIQTHHTQLTSDNAIVILEQYDVIVDATDNVATRYLLNDACVMLGKPLVSGSALQLEGQLTVYNYRGGPCYRCLFPTPPPPESVTNCGDGGVLGAITGVIGALQALETIKIVLSNEGVLSGRLLLFDGQQSAFRNLKLRPKKPTCAVCSDTPTVTKLVDYEQFCRMKATDKDTALSLLAPSERISVREYHDQWVATGQPHLLIDVRGANQFEMCQLPGTPINIPIEDILSGKRTDEILSKLERSPVPVYVVCRRGNDSQLAVRHLEPLFRTRNLAPPRDLSGGLHAWTKTVDPNFPIY